MQKARPRASRCNVQKPEGDKGDGTESAEDEGLEVLKAIVLRMQTEHEAALGAIGAWYDKYVGAETYRAKPANGTIITPN